MALTKIGSIGVSTGIQFAGVTTVVTLNSSDNILAVGGTVNFNGDVSIGGSVSIGGTLTYEDVTNIDAVGLITARDGIVVGSGITLSVDGDIFATGITTISENLKVGTGVTISPDGDGFFTGIVTATTFSGAFSGDGSALTGVANTDVIFPDKISLGDGAQTSGDQINIGIGSDLRIYHNGSHNYLDSVNGNIYLRVNSTENAIKCTENGNVEIAYDGTKKIETASGGVTVTGTVAATSYTGDGSALTGIVAGVQTEAASISGITTYLDLTKDDHELVVTGTNTISVIGGSQGDSHTLRIENSGIATVTLDPTYFKFPSGGTPAFPITSGAKSLVSFTVHKAGAVGVNTFLMTGVSVSFS